METVEAPRRASMPLDSGISRDRNDTSARQPPTSPRPMPLRRRGSAARGACYCERSVLEGGDPTTPRASLEEAVKPAALPAVQAVTFGEVAKRWHDIQSQGWARTNRDRTWSRLERFLLEKTGPKKKPYSLPRPILIDTPIVEIDTLVFRRVLVRAKASGRGGKPLGEPATRLRVYASGIFHLEIEKGVAITNPTKDLLKSIALQNQRPTRTFASLAEPKGFGTLLRIVDTYNGGIIVTSALGPGPRLVVRPGELRSIP